MATDHKIKTEKVKCHINNKAAKTSALSTGKIDK